ncbi:hypothetical protein GOBAR_DD12098 [Gossypium barbadense]|nr:hypothetical protein GOBAR_DD12098 [Gossypium barbadense]
MEGELGPNIMLKGVVDGQQDARCPYFFKVRRGRENALSQCSSTKCYGVEVTHAILLEKAQTTFNKSPVTLGERVPPHKRGHSDQAWATVYQKHKSLGSREPVTKVLVNNSRNYNDPKVAKFLVGGQKDPMKLHCSLGLALSFSDTAYASRKVTDACKGFLGPDGDWPLSTKAEGSLIARTTRQAGEKVSLSDLTVPSGWVVTQRIKVTLGITG